MDFEALGIDRSVVAAMYAEWCAGAPKSALERRYLGKAESHGKLFSALVREVLGVETERPSRLRAENARLRAEVARLEAEVAQLRAALARLQGAVGPGGTPRTGRER